MSTICRMEAAEKLGTLGWNLTTEGLQQVSENGCVTDPKKLVRSALDLDIREIGSGSFPEDIGKGKLDSIPGKIIVQVQKIRNVSAPKVNEESRAAPRMLKLSITDGVTVCQAIEVANIPSLSLNTPPGTKLFLKAKCLPVVHGIILLSPASVDVLGGKVTALVDKWELNRTLAKHTRGQIGEEGGPPPWIPFGQKILRTNPQDRNFKSFDGSKDKEHQDNAEFEAQRKDAIAEAARGGAKKVFGGGNKPLLDHNVQQLVDYGFALDQAEYALRVTRNNVERALRLLQRGEESRPKPREMDEPREERRERRKRGDREEEGGTAPKPSARVSLFDFLEDKLPVQNEKEVADSRSYGGGNSSGDKRFSESNRSGGGRSSVQGPSRSSRGGRGRGATVSWSDRDTKDRGGHNSYRREDRYDRNHHGGSERQNHVVPMHQQKPPRFQNQQRQQQQESVMQQQNWSQPPQSYNDTTSNWTSRNQTINFKNQDNDFQNTRESSSTSMYDSRNRNSRSYSNRYGMDSSGGHFEDIGNNQAFPRQDRVDLSAKLASQHISRDVDSYQKPLSTIQPQNSIFPVDFGFKESHIGGGFGGIYDSFGIGAENLTNQYSPETKAWPWHKGDKCMAKYWEDNMYYNAEVTGVSHRTCVVRFLEYGNFEEVLQDDCIPFSEEGLGQTAAQSTNQLPQQNHFSGIVEFRRGGPPQPFIKSNADHVTGSREGNPHRVHQQMYLPPAQRK